MKRKKGPSSFARRVGQLWLQTHKLVACAKKATSVPGCLIVWISKRRGSVIVPEHKAEDRVLAELLGLREVKQ